MLLKRDASNDLTFCFNGLLHQDVNLRKDERKRIEQDNAPAYAAAHAGMTVEEATDRLVAQLLRQVDTTAASQGGWDQDAPNYLNAYAAAHPGETIGKDQWGNAVPLFGTASGYQRNDSTIFSVAPQTTNPPPQLGLGAVGEYLAGMGQRLADTIGHPLDTLRAGLKAPMGLSRILRDAGGDASCGDAGRGRELWAGW
ncbi:hypothetical protein [Mycetohabitans rhizoxinica]|uniref:hypothetical protein n=1 Tax=Mycetohabitans rhizoxinica TaxID=412963 RepID=UPI0030D4FDE5